MLQKPAIMSSGFWYVREGVHDHIFITKSAADSFYEQRIKDGDQRTIDFVIVNDTDRPCARLVAQVMSHGLTCKYIDPALKDYPEFSLEKATSLTEFGFTIAVSEFSAVFSKTNESVAKYEDGRTREWQGEDFFLLELL